MEANLKNKITNIIKHPLSLYLLVILNSPEEVNNSFILIGGIIVFVFYNLQIKWMKYIQALGIFLSLYFVIGEHRTIFSLDGGTNFLTLLLAMKALENKKESNRGFIFIALALNASYSLYNQDLYSTILLLSSFVWGFFLIYNQTLSENQATSTFNSNFLKNPRIYLYSAFSILVAVLFYAFFPRISFHFPKNSSLTSNSGFSGDLKPGSQSKLNLSNQAIFSVKFQGNAPALPKLYWVGAVLTETDGYFWKPKNGYIENQGRLRPDNDLDLYNYQVQLHSQTTEYLYHLDRPISKPELSEPFYRASDKSYRLFNEVPEKFNYKGTSLVRKITPGKETKFVTPKKYVKTSLKVAQLARSLRDDSPENTLENFRNYFINNDFVYTLEPGTTELLDDFLFKSKRGFCSHYASALAVLMRFAGFYSRVVTGFQGGDYNEIGDFFVLRGKDAHAWMEYLNGDNQWVRVDPVEWIVPERIQMGGQQFFALSPTGETDPLDQDKGFFESLQFTLIKYADNFNRQWQALLYNYDREAQRNLAKKLGISAFKFFAIGFVLICIIAGAVYFILSKLKKVSPIELEIEKIETLAKRIGHTRKNEQSFAHFISELGQKKKSLNDSALLLKEETLKYFFSSKPTVESEYLKLLKSLRLKLQKEVKS